MLQAIIASFSQPGSGFMWAITAALALGLAVGLDRVWSLSRMPMSRIHHMRSKFYTDDFFCPMPR